MAKVIDDDFPELNIFWHDYKWSPPNRKLFSFFENFYTRGEYWPQGPDIDIHETLNANIRDILSIRKQTLVYKEANICFLEMRCWFLFTRRLKLYTSTFTFFIWFVYQDTVLFCLHRIWKQTVVYKEVGFSLPIHLFAAFFYSICWSDHCTVFILCIEERR